MWLNFCKVAFFWGIYSWKQLLEPSIQQVQLKVKRKSDVDAGCAFVHTEFYCARYSFNCSVLFFLFKIKLRPKFIISFVRVFLFHVCEYSTSSLEPVSKVILGSLTNVQGSVFLYARLLLMTVSAQQLLLVVFKVLLLSFFFFFKQNRTFADKCNIPAIVIKSSSCWGERINCPQLLSQSGSWKYFQTILPEIL